MIAGYMVDISNPQNYDFTGTSVIPSTQHHFPRANAFYIGGNTPHIWTKEQIVRQTNDYRLPIWVYDPQMGGASNGSKDGLTAVSRCKDLGMPHGFLICLDMEVSLDRDYSKAFFDTVVKSGYKYVVYESESVTGNFVGPNGRWGAEWDNSIHIVAGDWATQYADSKMTGHPFDISAVSNFGDLWNIRATQTPPDPAPVVIDSVTVNFSNGSTKVFKP